MSGIIDLYTKEELTEIIKQSYSVSEALLKLGYNTCHGGNHKIIRDRIKQYNIDCSHFKPTKTIRTPENIFVKNSEAQQNVVRRWYKKGNYSSYICSICGLKPVWQGKPLTLILDHVDGDNKNHEINNLRWVCPNCNQQLPTTGYSKLQANKHKQDKKKYFCAKCNKEIESRRKYCKECYEEIKIDTKKFFEKEFIEKCIPTNRNELKQLIRSYSFSQIGRQFNVCDNTIRKWCKKFNLPHTKTEINTYSIEEWETI